MVAKKKLSSLIADLPKDSDSKTIEVTDSESSEVTDSVILAEQQLEELFHDSSTSHEQEVKQVDNQQTVEVTESVSEPKYLTLERKEARITQSQVESLARLSRDLNRKRKGQGERITENTLIRVAIALLVSRQDEIQGITEEELMKSLGL
jgi:RNA polymerase-interacting CarD/CdnL/TRCF family regulator